MNKIIYFILLSIILIINIDLINSKRCIISVLLSGDINDLGYNYLFNDARVRAENIIGSDFSIYYSHLEESQEIAEQAVIDSIERGSNLIIIGSFVHVGLGLKYASKYQGEDIYWIIRGNKRPSPDLPKVVILNFNSFELHYILGYYAGLMTKTGTVGFIAPGPDINTISTDNSFYLGARHSRSNVTFLNAYVGSWYNPTVSYKAAQMLISNGADVIGMSQDDMSVQKALMDADLLGMGVTGFPGHIIYGADVGISYITNWTNLVVKYATHVIDDDWPAYSSYFTNLSRKDSIFIDSFSFRVPIDVQEKVNAELDKLTYNTSYVPYKSDPYLAQLGIPFGDDGLLDDALFRNNKILLKGDAESTVIDYSFYTIPIEFVDFPMSLKVGVTVVSGICIGMCLISMALVVLFKKARVIKSSSPSFLLLILFGMIIIFSGCIIFARSPSDGTCSARVWLLSLGYTIFLGNLLVKNWRIWLLFDNPKLKKRAITNWKLYPWVIAIVLVDLFILSIWQGLGEIHAQSRAGIDSLSEYEYTNVCSHGSDRGDVALYILLVFHGLMLLLACFISFKIKVVDIEEFNESKPITTSVYIITFCLFIVIPLMVSDPTVVSQTTIISVCAIVTTFISLVLLFGTKFFKMITQGVGINETFATSKSKSSSIKTSRSTKSSKSSYGKDPNRINFGEDDTSDEISEEKHKSPKTSVLASNSHLATFTSDEETSKTSKFSIEQESKEIEQQQETELVNEQQQQQQQEPEQNVSVVQSLRLSAQKNGETEIDSNNL